MQQIDIDRLQCGAYTSQRERLSPALLAQAKATGLIQPVLVRTLAEGDAEIVGSPQSWYLAQQIGVDKISVIPVDHLAPPALQTLAKPATAHFLDRADQIAQACHHYRSQAAYSHATGMPRSVICNALRIHQLPETTRALIRDHPDTIKEGHVKVIARLDSGAQRFFLKKVVAQQLSVRDLTAAIHGDGHPTTTPPTTRPREVIQLEEAISNLIGCPTRIEMETGELVIDYRKNNDVLSGVLERLGWSPD